MIRNGTDSMPSCMRWRGPWSRKTGCATHRSMMPLRRFFSRALTRGLAAASFLLFAHSLSSCRGTRTASSPTPLTPAVSSTAHSPPEWASIPSGTLDSSKGVVVVGIGSASAIKNAKLACTTASNRARAEVWKFFESVGGTCTGDWEGGPPERCADVFRRLEVLRKMKPERVSITRIWRSPHDAGTYALAIFSFADFASDGSLDERDRVVVEAWAKALADSDRGGVPLPRIRDEGWLRSEHPEACPDAL